MTYPSNNSTQKYFQIDCGAWKTRVFTTFKTNNVYLAQVCFNLWHIVCCVTQGLCSHDQSNYMLKLADTNCRILTKWPFTHHSWRTFGKKGLRAWPHGEKGRTNSANCINTWNPMKVVLSKTCSTFPNYPRTILSGHMSNFENP